MKLMNELKNQIMLGDKLAVSPHCQNQSAKADACVLMPPDKLLLSRGISVSGVVDVVG